MVSNDVLRPFPDLASLCSHARSSTVWIIMGFPQCLNSIGGYFDDIRGGATDGVVREQLWLANSTTAADWLCVSEDTINISKITRQFFAPLLPVLATFQLLLAVINLLKLISIFSGEFDRS